MPAGGAVGGAVGVWEKAGPPSNPASDGSLPARLYWKPVVTLIWLGALLMAKGFTPTDVVTALQAQNIILPAGTARIGSG